MIIKIIVSSEQEKRELIEASRHIHYLREVNLDLEGVNFLAHLYRCEQIIIVDQNQQDD